MQWTIYGEVNSAMRKTCLWLSRQLDTECSSSQSGHHGVECRLWCNHGRRLSWNAHRCTLYSLPATPPPSQQFQTSARDHHRVHCLASARSESTQPVYCFLVLFPSSRKISPNLHFRNAQLLIPLFGQLISCWAFTLAMNSNHDRVMANLNVQHGVSQQLLYLTDFPLVSIPCYPSSMGAMYKTVWMMYNVKYVHVYTYSIEKC
jgi:hypothetical protein